MGGELVEELADLAVFESRSRAAEDAPRLVVGTEAAAIGVELDEAALGRREREVRTSGEEAVEQEELRRARRVDRAVIGPKVGLVRRAAAESGDPVRHALGQAQPHAEEASGHVDALEAASEHEEAPAVVAAHRRVRDSCRDRDTLLHELREPEERVGPDRPRGRDALVERDVRRVEALPELRGDRLAYAPSVVAGADDRRDDRARLGRVEREERGHLSELERIAGRFGDPHDREQCP